jgi:hypothetical protein
MSLLFRPYFADSDQLLLGGHVLAALELGRMRMDAHDYLEIAAWMGDVIDRLDTPMLLRLRKEGPASVRVMAENALNDRGEVDWLPSRLGRVKAEAEWRALRRRLAERTE